MNILQVQADSLKKQIGAGLTALHRPRPVTAVEWMNEHYYLPVESSYQEGRWETLPFQVAIINSMGNDDIREVNLMKSARVGYSKMLLGVTAFLLEHKKRNGLLFQPTDGDAENFMKAHVEPVIRDVPRLRELAPWYGKKHRDNTLSAKRFTNGRGLWVLGGKAAKNYREKSVDFVIYDELAAFDPDVEKEGSPTFLGDKRIEGSTWPKSIRGSTPKIAGQCQIERAASESPHLMRFHVPCPHCGELQHLKWGGRDCAFGIKWDGDDPRTAFYQCEKTGCVIKQSELEPRDGIWICDRTGLRTKDGIDWFDEHGKPTDTPESVTWHIWTAYSPFTTWVQIVKDFLKAKGDPGKLKTFVNTTLGETWEEETGEKLEWETIAARREVWNAQVPQRVIYITAGVDVQDDRFEFEITGWGAGEEHWPIEYGRLFGDLDRQEIWDKLREHLTRSFTRADGTQLDIRIGCIDSGGHYTDEVYRFCKSQPHRWIPVKGANVYGKPVATMPRKRNRRGVYLTEVGTDNAKDIIYSRLAMIPPNLTDPCPGYRHHPMADWADEAYFKGLTAERKKLEFLKGRRVYRWECPKGVRNEPLDCAVYSLAAIRIGVQHFGLNLNQVTASPAPPPPVEKQEPTAPASQNSGWLGSVNRTGWL